MAELSSYPETGFNVFHVFYDAILSLCMITLHMFFPKRFWFISDLCMSFWLFLHYFSCFQLPYLQKLVGVQAGSLLRLGHMITITYNARGSSALSVSTCLPFV